MTEETKIAILWFKAKYGRAWKRHIVSRPEDLPKGYEVFHYFPYGIPAWNVMVRLARLAVASYGIDAAAKVKGGYPGHADMFYKNDNEAMRRLQEITPGYLWV